MPSHTTSASATVGKRRPASPARAGGLVTALRPLWDVDASGWFAYGTDGRLAYVNRSFQRITSSRPSLGTQELVPVVAVERRSALRRAFNRLRAGEQASSSGIVPVVVNGTERPLLLSLTAIVDRSEGNHVVGVVSPVAPAPDPGRAATQRAELLEQVLDRIRCAVSAVFPEEDDDLAAVLDSDGLSARQRDVLRLLLRGDSAGSVAASLHLSTHTVRNYEKAIFKKFGVHSQAELIALTRAMRRHPSVRSRAQHASD